MEKGFPPPPRLSRNPPHPFTLYPGTLSRRSDTRPETKPNPEQITTPARRRCRKHSRRQSRRHGKPGRHTIQRKPGDNTARETIHKARKASRRHTPGDIPAYTIQAREKPVQARRHARVIWLPDTMPGGILSGFLPIKGKKSKKAHVFRHCISFVLLPGYPIDIN